MEDLLDEGLGSILECIGAGIVLIFIISFIGMMDGNSLLFKVISDFVNILIGGVPL